MIILKWLKLLRQKKVNNCLKENHKNPNAYIIIRGSKIYNNFEFAKRYVPCSYCRYPPIGEQDHCIANLPNVKFACCGHGNREKASIVFNNGMIIRGFIVEKYLQLTRR